MKTDPHHITGTRTDPGTANIRVDCSCGWSVIEATGQAARAEHEHHRSRAMDRPFADVPGPGSAGYPACPHDGAKCHHHCRTGDRVCERKRGRMRLSTPWPGYPVDGDTVVTSDSDRERRGVLVGFSNEKKDR